MTDIEMWIEDFFDTETDARRQNDKLAGIVKRRRNARKIHLIERLEETEGARGNGWRLHYEKFDSEKTS